MARAQVPFVATPGAIRFRKRWCIDADGGKRRAMEIRRSEKQTARQLPGGEHPRP
jgi:hypothetical protein